MRARYYSPVLKRFLTPDTYLGDVTKTASLNRYAFANGDPVNFIDPTGHNPEKGSLSGYLDKILEILSTSDSLQSNVKIGSIEYYSNITSTLGKGDVNVSIIANEQLEILKSISFSNENIIVSADGLSIEYSHKIDEYNTISASLSYGSNNSIAAEYTIKTLYNDNSVSTTLGMKYSKETNKNDSVNWGGVFSAIGIGIGAIVTAYAIANNATGIGLIDDLVLLPLGTMLLKI